MAAAQHTPGPWRVDPEFPADVETADSHFQIASVHDDNEDQLPDRRYAPPECEALANATLIAAAPEMLAALRAAETFMMIVPPTSRTAECLEVLERVRVAIAKAEGRP